jgi:hypothetical protein
MMEKTEHTLPRPNRSARELAFVLRKAKWSHGPEVLRAMARKEVSTRSEDKASPPAAPPAARRNKR